MSNSALMISVDVEASGPYPGRYSLLSIGACVVHAPEQTFYCELKPATSESDPAAMSVTGFSLDELTRRGLEPAKAMRRFETWLETVKREDDALLFVGFNAAFDWAFVNHYFLQWIGRNPFGFAALDIKSYYMGATGVPWADTKSSVMTAALGASLKGDHNALNDALYQAELFRLAEGTIRERSRR